MSDKNRILLFAGLLFMVCSIVLCITATSRINGYSKTKATVTELVEKKDSDGDTYYDHILSFRTDAGHEYTCSASTRLGIGETTIVAFPKDQPTRAEEPTYTRVFGPSLVLAMFAILFTVLGYTHHIAQRVFDQARAAYQQ